MAFSLMRHTTPRGRGYRRSLGEVGAFDDDTWRISMLTSQSTGEGVSVRVLIGTAWHSCCGVLPIGLSRMLAAVGSAPRSPATGRAVREGQSAVAAAQRKHVSSRAHATTVTLCGLPAAAIRLRAASDLQQVVGLAKLAVLEAPLLCGRSVARRESGGRLPPS
jgi:hypothetical protein